MGKLSGSDRGLANYIRTSWGPQYHSLSLKIIDEPLSIFIYSPFAVYVALIYIALPYVFISIFNSLEKPQKSLDASADLC